MMTTTATLPCPIEGLTYTRTAWEGTRGTMTCYALAPCEGYRMRVYSMDTRTEDGTRVPFFVKRLCLAQSYDFTQNSMGITAEKTEETP